MDFVSHHPTNIARSFFHPLVHFILHTLLVDSLHRTVGRGFARLSVEADDVGSAITSYYTLVAYPVQIAMVQLQSPCFLAACIFWCD